MNGSRCAECNDKAEPYYVGTTKEPCKRSKFRTKSHWPSVSELCENGFHPLRCRAVLNRADSTSLQPTTRPVRTIPPGQRMVVMRPRYSLSFSMPRICRR